MREFALEMKRRGFGKPDVFAELYDPETRKLVEVRCHFSLRSFPPSLFRPALFGCADEIGLDSRGRAGKKKIKSSSH
jgi:hypothetical protein